MTPAQIIRDHYHLPRPITQKEVEAEIAMLRRRGIANLDDRQALLAARLDLFK